jgi:hypothetical protein
MQPEGGRLDTSMRRCTEPSFFVDPSGKSGYGRLGIVMLLNFELNYLIINLNILCSLSFLVFFSTITLLGTRKRKRTGKSPTEM